MLFIHSKYCLRFYLVLMLLATQLSAYALSTIEGDLPRRADLGFRFSAAASITVSKIEKGSPAASSGLQKDDIITAINGTSNNDISDTSSRLRRSVGGQTLTLGIRRGSENLTLHFNPKPKPLENIPGIDSYYGVVDISQSTRLRSIVAAPSGTTKALPAVFFVQWVSCGSLEYNPRSTSGQIMSNVIEQTGRTFVRVERSTSGDSKGPLCHELDYDTEIEHYYQAFLRLKKHPLVDPDNIVLYGSSLGSTIAPLLAEKLLHDGHKVAGLMIQGGGALTYFERMLNFERNYLERKTDTNNQFAVEPSSIHSEFIQRSLFYTEYLIHGRHPDEIAKDSKSMTYVRNNIMGLNKREHYGRPFTWHQQAAKHNLLKAWQRINTPVLVVFNEYDQFEQRHGHQIIVDMINRWRPGTATFVEQKHIGHSNYQYSSIEEAYSYKGGQAAPQKLAQHLVSWLKRFGK